MRGIKSPKYLENNQVNRDRILNGDLGDMVVFKTTYHSRGRGMIVCSNTEVGEIHSNGYFEESQVSKREFRVHVMDGEAFYIDEKRPREVMDEQPIVKNMKSGYKFRRPLKDFPDEVITESIKAVKALGLDFGAADVGLNDEGVWIYEVNTAPSLRTKTRKLYQKALVKAIWLRISASTEIAEAKSMEYNEWLDSQPLTPHTYNYKVCTNRR
jgi:glutathione synthase/RimK-type ligase-like ATP-grasp enzyme